MSTESITYDAPNRLRLLMGIRCVQLLLSRLNLERREIFFQFHNRPDAAVLMIHNA